MNKLKILIAGLIGFFLGMAVLYVFLRENPRAAPEPFPSSEDQFLYPMEEARRLQEEMEKAMKVGGNSREVEVKEDEKWVSYEISDVDATTLSASVKNGMLVISGETRKQSGGATFATSFQRMLSLPPNVDPQKMETMSEENKVILRFPKKL